MVLELCGLDGCGPRVVTDRRVWSWSCEGWTSVILEL